MRPLPDFCHKIQWNTAHRSLPSKAVSRGHPDITMRLETPVIYFHPSKEMKLPFAVDVDVQFRNGWLTQFYPDAKVGASGLSVERGKFKVEWLADGMTGGLSWRNLQVGAQGEPPATDLHVWTAPRKVEGATVAGQSGETERFVFYRGGRAAGCADPGGATCESACASEPAFGGRCPANAHREALAGGFPR